MRRRTLFQLLSAIFVVSTAACFPDYSFDLVETDDPDASVSDDAATGEDAAEDASEDVATDGGDLPDEAGVDAGEDGADGAPQDAGPDVDAPDADAGDAAPDADDGEAGPVDGGEVEPPEPDCTGSSDGGVAYACVPRAPTGWSGPVALYNDLSGVPTPSCPDGFFQTPVFEGHSQLDIKATSCSTCSCSVSGVTCSPLQALPPLNPGDPTEPSVSERFYSGEGCSSGCVWTREGGGTQFTPGICTPLMFSNANECPAPVAAELGTSTPSGTPSCVPSPQTPAIPPVAWHDIARACHAPTSDKGCDEGFVCAPEASHPFEANLCIVRIGEGDVDCPDGPYSQKFLFYRDAEDTRSCTDCQCGSASSVRCEGELQTFAGTTGCVNPDGSVLLGTCGSFPSAVRDGDSYMKRFRLVVEPKATCPASGGQPVGTVTPTRPQTICCMP